MKRNSRSLGSFLPAFCLSVLFILYTMLIRHIDVKPIGPNGSAVGLASVNGWVHDLFGVHWTLYKITDYLGLVPIFAVLGFAVLGLTQLIRRKSLLRVDSSILVLGGFYVLVMGVYLFFEYYRVNYRPVLIDGILETSYPSSTTILVLCVMPTAIMQFRRLICNKTVRNAISTVLTVFTVFMVIGRLVSGIHWLTDILGGVLLSAALVLLYRGVNACIAESQLEAISAEVNKRLVATTTSSTTSTSSNTAATSGSSYSVRISTSGLRIRKGPGTNYGIAQNAIAPGVYTIVAESSGAGSTKGWGKLKSGAGWISLDYAAKV